jgi:hypothetical protein
MKFDVAFIAPISGQKTVLKARSGHDTARAVLSG